MDYLDDASLVTLYFLGNIAEVEERVENLHNQLELIRHERVVVHEIILCFVATIGCRQLELKVETCLIFVVECHKLWFYFLFLVENTLLGNHLWLCAFQGNLHFEASLDLAFLILLFCNVAIVHNLRKVLLGGTSHPYLVVASLREFGDNLLEVEITVTLLVDELAHLIGKEDKTIVIALIFQIGSQFHTEAVDAHIGVSLDDALTDAIYRKGRGKLFGNIQHPIQFVVNQVGSHTRVVPVATFLSNALLEGFEYALFGKRLFQVLCQGDIKLVEATLAVELIPEYVKESLLLVCRVVVAGFQVEDAGVDGGTLQPVGDREQLVVIETEVVLLIEWVDGFYGCQKAAYGSLAGSRSNTVVEVFQEVRLT